MTASSKCKRHTCKHALHLQPCDLCAWRVLSRSITNLTLDPADFPCLCMRLRGDLLSVGHLEIAAMMVMSALPPQSACHTTGNWRTRKSACLWIETASGKREGHEAKGASRKWSVRQRIHLVYLSKQEAAGARVRDGDGNRRSAGSRFDGAAGGRRSSPISRGRVHELEPTESSARRRRHLWRS